MKTLFYALAVACALPCLAQPAVNQDPLAEEALVEDLYRAVQYGNTCVADSYVRESYEKGDTVNLMLTSVSAVLVPLVMPFVEDYQQFSPMLREVQANARSGIMDLDRSPHYASFVENVNTLTENHARCDEAAREELVALTKYLNFKAQEAASAKQN